MNISYKGGYGILYNMLTWWIVTIAEKVVSACVWRYNIAERVLGACWWE